MSGVRILRNANIRECRPCESCINMHFSAYKMFTEKNSLFFKKSNARFFQKQAVFFRERHGLDKMHIYAVPDLPEVRTLL